MLLLLVRRPDADSLEKATSTRTITVPTFTRKDGTVIPAHTKRVHYDPDRAHADILAGKGTHSQKVAHKRLQKEPGFHKLSDDDKLSVILSHATDHQKAKSAAADVVKWKAAKKAGKKPTKKQQAAFDALPKERREEVMGEVGGGQAKPQHPAAKPKPDFSSIKSAAYKVASGMFGRDIIASSIQNDWQRLLDAMDAKDIGGLDSLMKKYTKDMERDGYGSGTSGAGPGSVRQARPGASQLARFALEAKNALQPTPTKTEALKEAVAHLKEDSAQADLPPKEKKEDAALVAKLEEAAEKPEPAQAALPLDIEQPKEGDTKTEKGNTYVLRGGRWHLDVTPEEHAENKADLADALMSGHSPERVKELLDQVHGAEIGHEHVGGKAEEPTATEPEPEAATEPDPEQTQEPQRQPEPEPTKEPEPAKEEPAQDPAPGEYEETGKTTSSGEPQILYVTKRGKRLLGVMRDMASRDEARKIDPYSFRKDGKYFIREQHLEVEQAKPPQQADEAKTQEGPKDGDTKIENGVEYRLVNGRWHRVDRDREEPTATSPDPVIKPEPLTQAESELVGHLDRMTDDKVVSIASALVHQHKVTSQMAAMVAMMADRVPEAEGATMEQKNTAAWMAENFDMTHNKMFDEVIGEARPASGGAGTIQQIRSVYKRVPVTSAKDMRVDSSVERKLLEMAGIPASVGSVISRSRPFSSEGVARRFMHKTKENEYVPLQAKIQNFLNTKAERAHADKLLDSDAFRKPRTLGEKAAVMAQLVRQGAASEGDFADTTRRSMHLSEPKKKEIADGAPSLQQLIDGSRSVDDLVTYRLAGSLNQAKINEYHDTIRQARSALAGIQNPGRDSREYGKYLSAVDAALSDAGFKKASQTSAFNGRKVTGVKSENGTFIELSLASFGDSSKRIFSLPSEGRVSSYADPMDRLRAIEDHLAANGRVRAATASEAEAAIPKEKRVVIRKEIPYKPQRSTKQTRMTPTAFYGSATESEKRTGTTDITKMMREDIKRGVKAGRIPKGMKISVTKDHNSIGIKVKGAPVGMPIANPDYAIMMANHPHGIYGDAYAEVHNELGMDSRDVKRESEELAQVMSDLDAIHSKYNWNNSDPSTDYFDVNYYGQASIDYDLLKDSKAPNPATASPGDRITLMGSQYVLRGNPPRWHKDAGATAAPEKEQAQVDRTKQISRLRKTADSTISKATDKLEQPRQTNTRRRVQMAASVEADARRAISVGKTMHRIADAIERGEAEHLADIKSRAQVEALRNVMRRAVYDADVAANGGRGRENGKRPPVSSDANYATYPGAGSYYSDDRDRLMQAGIMNSDQLRAAMTEYVQHVAAAPKADPIQQAERALVGKKVGIDFFPTPPAIAARMASMAGIKPGMTVLEPSAGSGNLADAVKHAGGRVHAIEISNDLRAVLKAKGHEVVEHDFDEFKPAQEYDAVIMNPPFSSRKDAEHIQRAWGMVKPGGSLVAIAGEGVFFGSDKKATQFRGWLDENGAEIEKLPENSFMGANQLAQTGVNARLISMRKPGGLMGKATTPRLLLLKSTHLPASVAKRIIDNPPTEAQAEAGNYPKGTIRWRGFTIRVENPAGSVRKGNGWKTKMANDYGYLRGTDGVDGDEVDVYLGPDLDAEQVFVVHQRKYNDWKRYDEDKVMIGFGSEGEAKAAYLKHYDDDRFLGPVTAMPVDEFAQKLRERKGAASMIKSTA